MSMRSLGAALLCLTLLGAVACQKSAGPSAEDYQKQRAAMMEKQKAAAPPASAEPAAEENVAAQVENYFYDPIGKRDPFRSFILDRIKDADADAKGPLEQFDLSQLDVTGVMWEGERRRALVLDPSGQTYIVQEGDPIGKNDGRVVSIGDSVMKVRETYVDFHQEATTKEIEMRVRQSQGG